MSGCLGAMRSVLAELSFFALRCLWERMLMKNRIARSDDDAVVSLSGILNCRLTLIRTGCYFINYSI